MRVVLFVYFLNCISRYKIPLINKKLLDLTQLQWKKNEVIMEVVKKKIKSV